MSRQTEVRVVDPRSPAAAAIEAAAALLRTGELVAYPTETVYGLAADGLSECAVRAVIAAKGRPAEKGIILAVADPEQVAALAASVPPAAWRLMARFFPGPLTLVLLAGPAVPPAACGPGGTVAVRMPDHPVALALIRALGRPITSTSANPSGTLPPRTAAEVLRGLSGRIALVLDAGPAPGGVPSTVVDLTRDPPVILREGAVSETEVREALAKEEG
ncbi:MAG: threonylcarbamoyl-AMP synthase [Armatimonadetes bacterium]|nr:threonylcarbamoyl-AMP synthase [Armatimonadota bacterium]